MLLKTADYAVTVTMLVIPLAIGFFFAWKDSTKRANRDEYLLGGRKMGVMPVALSLFVTFQSAVSMLGYPSDVYQYGPMVIFLCFGYSLTYVLAAFVTIVPLMYPLQLTSAYDYLEMRFQSKALRTFCTVIGMVQTFFYMAMVLLAPGLALQAAAGIPLWVSVAVVGTIGTLYSAVGGIKSVIWTDVFQTVVLTAGILMLIVRGVVVAGGVSEVWRIAGEGGRTSLAALTLDPRIRHSWLGVSVGAMFLWQTTLYNQATVQRLGTMRSLGKAKLAFLLNLLFNQIYPLLLGGVGLVTFVYFYNARCDPFEGGLITNKNQISLYFMLHSLQDYPGLPGFYMATIFSGALSTLSSGINALATNTVEDILAGWLRPLSERSVVLVVKCLVFAYGWAIVGASFLFESVQGPVTQLSALVLGAFGSVVVAIFLVGSTVPWANKYGAFVGGSLTLVVNSWVAVGGLFYGRTSPPLQPPSTDGCSSANNSSFIYQSTFDGHYPRSHVASLNSSRTNAGSVYQSTSGLSGLNVTSLNTVETTPFGAAATEDPDEYGFFLYDISYEWYTFIGTLVCSFLIVIISRLTRGKVRGTTNARLILPILRRYWQLEDIPTTQDNDLGSFHLDT